MSNPELYEERVRYAIRLVHEDRSMREWWCERRNEWKTDYQDRELIENRATAMELLWHFRSKGFDVRLVKVTCRLKVCS